MEHLFYRRILNLLFFLAFGYIANAQQYDVLIKGGHLIDPKNSINEKMDIAILDGKIAMVARQISEDDAKKTIHAKSMYITPGLIDMHVHVFAGTKPDAYISNSFTSLPPDGFTFRAGVTTAVDAGSSGWKNFRIFKEQIIDQSKTRILAFLNIVGSGMKGGPIEQNLVDMDAKLTAMTAKRYADFIVGIKLAHYSGPEWDPLDRSVEAGKLADIPVMVDFGGHTPELSLDTLLNVKFRSGDIFTHCYANVNGRASVVDENGKVRPYVFAAQKKGIVFDVGHGGGSFQFAQAVPALEQGFKPNSISTDLHTGSMNGGMKGMLNVMSKFLNMGMTLNEVIKSSTWDPAVYIKHEEIGHLSVGAIADIAVLNVKKGDFGYYDVKNLKINGTQKLECELTIKDGNVVWDLNGISKLVWDNETENK
jgi:dihydroorotase